MERAEWEGRLLSCVCVVCVELCVVLSCDVCVVL